MRLCRVSYATVLEYVSAVQDSPGAAGSIVFSTADFPSSHLQKQLAAAPNIRLHREAVPYYADEKSCEYGDLFDNPIA